MQIDPPFVPPIIMVGPAELDTDLAHGQDVGTEVDPLDPFGNGSLHITTHRLLGNLSLPSPFPLDGILGIRAPTVRHLPAALQDDVSMALGGAISRYCRSPSTDHLFAILAFPKLVLRSPMLRGPRARDNMFLAIKGRLRAFMQGELMALCEELLRDTGPLTTAGPETRSRKRARLEATPSAIPPRTLDRVRQLVGEGAARKALDTLLSTGTHDPTDPAVLHKLRSLHPQAPQPILSTLSATLDPMLGDGEAGFWEPIIRDAVMHFPRASAPGPSGLRPSHLQDALRRRGRGLALLAALSDLTALWLKGALPQEHAPYLCGANLTPLRKPDGGVRPVAVGETLRRLVGKALLATGVSKRQVASLAPLQAGVGIRSATEAIAMGTNNLVSSLSATHDWALLKVDLSNAFNSLDRLAMLKGALAHAPASYNFLRFAYAQHAPLYIGDATLSSEQGTHQGCPLGPLGFAVGIQDVLQDVATASGLQWSSWYLDDGLLVGSPDRICAAMATLSPKLASLGLKVNTSKCEVWGPQGRVVAERIPGLLLTPWAPESGTTVLGVPISFPGSKVHTEKHWQTRIQALESATDLVTKVTDAQLAHHLLRQCLDGCRVNHLLRATPWDGEDDPETPGPGQAQAVILGAFEDIIGRSLSPAQSIQAC